RARRRSWRISSRAGSHWSRALGNERATRRASDRFGRNRLQTARSARNGGPGEIAEDARIGFARRPAVRAALLDDVLAQLAPAIAVPQRAQIEPVCAQVAHL